MSQELNYIGLFEFQGDKKTRSIKLTDFDEGSIQLFLKTPPEEYNKRRQNDQPYLKKIILTEKEKCYIIAAKPEINQDIANALKGIEDHILEHLSPALPDYEWKQRAIKIFITWNLSEKKELEDFSKQAQEVEQKFKHYGLIALWLTALTLILIYAIKNII